MALEEELVKKPKNVLPKPSSAKVELKKRKTFFSKTYLNPDGKFSAEVAAYPVHFRNKSGNLEEINNTLISKAIQGYDYENLANSITVRFARNNMNGKLVYYAADDEHWIAFSPAGKFVQEGIARGSSILYRGIKQGVDLEYIIEGNTLKERIILNSYTGISSFSFEVSYEGVALNKQTDGTIWAIDTISGQRLFILRKPSATDANDNFTDTITMDIVRDVASERIVLTLDSTWLKAAAYPVVIDPAVESTVEYKDTNNIFDAYVSSGYPTTNYGSNSYLHTGYLSGYNTIRSLLQYKYLPPIPPGAKVTSAYLSLFMYLGSTGGTTVDAFKITAPWDSTLVNWNSQPSIDAANPIATNFTSTPNTEWRIDITSAVRDWYSGASPNYGIMLRASNETSPKISFFSANAAGNPTPKLIVSYEIDGMGIEPYFGFYGNVNVHNGNLVINDIDVILPGRGVPITITRTYNSRSYATTVSGYGWRHNYLMKLTYSNSEIIRLTDGDGTEKVFSVDPGGGYRPPAGVESKLYVDAGVYVIEEKSGIKYYFGSQGRLDRVVDTNNNATTMSYLADGNIDRITDPSGRQVILSYTGGKLVRITGSAITTIEYVYTGNFLSRVRKLDSSGIVLNEIIYVYDEFNNLSTITDPESNITTLTYSYTPELGVRIGSIEKKLTISGAQQVLNTTIIYQNTTEGITTTITDPKGYITEYQTNNMGNVVKIIENKGVLNITTNFKWDEQQNLVEVLNPKGTLVPEEEKPNYETILDYNNSGSLVRVIDTQQNSMELEYYPTEDLKQIIDFSGRPIANRYDPGTRNMVTSFDPLSSSTVLERDSRGNVTSETDPIGLGGNILLNSGFEDWSGGLPVYWSKLSTGGVISDDTAQKVNGSHSVKLVSPGNLESQRAILISDYIPVTESYKYNISWYVKTINAGPDNGGAAMDIHWYTADKVWMGSQYVTANAAPTIGTTDTFLRKGIRVNAPVGARFSRIAPVLTGGPNNTQGTAWFDDIQFEYGSVINQYNFVFNSSFELDVNENNMPDGWWVPEAFTTQDMILDITYKHSGGRSFKLIGGTANKNFFQRIDKLTGDAGVPVHFSGWSRAAGVSSTGGSYRLLLQFNYEDGSIEQFPLDFSRTTHEWEYRETVVVSSKSFKGLVLYGILENQTGQVWFDDLLVRPAGAPNALISAFNITQNNSYEYDNNVDNWADNWTIFKSTIPGTYDIRWLTEWKVSEEETIKPIDRDRMIRIANVPGWATVANSSLEPLRTGETYTVSAVIKTVNAAGSGAVVKFDILDAAGGYLDQKVSETVTGTRDWSRVAVTLSTAEAKTINPGAAYIRATVGTLGATTGGMYFDAIRLSQGNERLRYVYDADGNYITGIINQEGNELDILSDGRGNITQVTDPKNNIYSFDYDELDNIEGAENPRGLKTLLYYDKNNNLKQIDTYGTAYMNTPIRIQYNELELPKTLTDARGRAANFEYDKNANLTGAVFPNGKQANYQYDGADRLKQVTYVGDTTAWVYDYDLNSNITKVTKNAAEETSYEYDTNDRLTKVTYPAVNQISNVSEYAYNPSGQILNIRNSPLPVQDQLVRYQYDYAGNNVDIFAPNNTNAAFMYDEESRLKKAYAQATGIALSTYRDYDENSRIIRLRTEDRYGNILFDTAYNYDANGNRIREIDNYTGKRVEYQYDSINQLIEESYYNDHTTTIPYRSAIYDYDLRGNRVLKNLNGTPTSYSYSIADEVTNTGYTFDANGNLTASGNYTFVYNAENQLVGTEYGGGFNASYEYDWRGLRTRKVTTSKTERYYYDGDDLAYITDDANKLKYLFVRDTNGRLLYMTDYSNYPTTPAKTYVYMHDAHGNIVALVDSSGSRIVNYQYDAWGMLINTPETTPMTAIGEPLWTANPFWYSGYQRDSETGLYYLKARYYSASLGRFLSRDVVLSINRYVYAGNNPVNYVDSEGFVRSVDDDTVMLPNEKIINTKTGATVNKPSDIMGQIKINFADTIIEKAIISATMSYERAAKYTFKRISVGTNVTFIDEVKLPAKVSGVRGIGKAGAVSLIFLGKDIRKNYSTYNAGEATARTGIEALALGGTLVATALATPVLISLAGVAATGFAAGAITFGTGALIGIVLDYAAGAVKEALF